jgi:hypothetical protein
MQHLFVAKVADNWNGKLLALDGFRVPWHQLCIRQPESHAIVAVVILE